MKVPHFASASVVLLSFVLPACGITHYVATSGSTPIPPYTNWMSAASNIQDAVDVAVSGDIITVSNGTYSFGGKAIGGTLTNRVAIDKVVTVQSVNGAGVTTIMGSPLTGGQAVRCVYLTNGAVLSGFSLLSGGTLTNGDSHYEQSGGGVLCDSPTAIINKCDITENAAGFLGGGAYSGTLNNCTVASNAAPSGGGGAYSALNGCAITGNQGTNGAGAYQCTLNTCYISGNSARDPAGASNGEGGGADSSNLTNCIVANNYALIAGGGAAAGVLVNCLITNNSAFTGGGVFGSFLINCTVFANASPSNTVDGEGGIGAGISDGTAVNSILIQNTSVSNGLAFVDNYDNSTLSYCCTMPAAVGAGNITNDPGFTYAPDSALRLTGNSSCINAGDNSDVAGAVDFDGNPRVVAGTVDIGAYEYQSPSSIISYAWLQRYGLPSDGSADNLDSDGDGMTNWQEWIAGTDPTNAASKLQMISIQPTNNPSGLTVTWQSVSGISYYLQRSTNLSRQPAFSTIESNLLGENWTTSYTDATATNSEPYYYRIAVQRD